MAKVSMSGPTVNSMKDNGKEGSSQAMGYGVVKTNTSESGKKTNQMASASILGQMVIFMRENGSTASDMAKAWTRLT